MISKKNAIIQKTQNPNVGGFESCTVYCIELWNIGKANTVTNNVHKKIVTIYWIVV